MLQFGPLCSDSVRLHDELCKAIRHRDPHGLVIMLTSMSSLDDKIEGYDAGADDYLVKPFEFRELLLKIRALLKRTPGQTEPVGNFLRAADLEMNLDNKEVYRAGRRIKLTAKEFQLLEYRRNAQTPYAGTSFHRLVRVGNDIRIAWKRVDLVNCDAPLEGLLVPF